MDNGEPYKPSPDKSELMNSGHKMTDELLTDYSEKIQDLEFSLKTVEVEKRKLKMNLTQSKEANSELLTQIEEQKIEIAEYKSEIFMGKKGA